MNKLNAAIIGATGYTGEELVRRLAKHPLVEIVALTSRQAAGKTASEIFPWLDRRSALGKLQFESPEVASLKGRAEVAFLALPHGVAAEQAAPLLEAGIRVVDLSADFRIKDPQVYEQFYGHTHPVPRLLANAVYGLPERHRQSIRTANLVACPGCYPTSVLIPLLPLILAGQVRPPSIVAVSMSGVSGAGRTVESRLMFVECNESVRPYGLPAHRHLAEIEQEISLAAGDKVQIQFAPHLVPLNRGIATTIHVDPSSPVTEEQVGATLTSAYGEEPFIRLLSAPQFPDVKNVAYTNAIEVGWRVDPRTGKVILMSAEDNLVKGAAGQAIQCLNIMQGWDEALGLN
ncbi:MAG: N-acetyl-gamma-glutamyl-phosphate reductase [Chthoniobacterales bacterium]